MLLTPEVLTINILNLLFFIFASIAFYYSVKIVLKYDFNATTTLQYNLEKQSYLVAIIIKFIFYIKVLLFIFFIFTLDNISTILPGAMCGAGVVNATEYGNYLLILKIINLYIFAYWLVLNNEDMKSEKQIYLKLKFKVYIFAYFLLLLEIGLESIMFFSIDTKSVVDCCGAIFSTTDGTYMARLLNINPIVLLSSFYAVFTFIIIAYIMKNRYLFSLMNLLFTIIALISLIAFFGTYIYELPTHHCPFCLLQKDYNYAGYFLYIFLFIGTFYGIVLGVIPFTKEEENAKYKVSLLFTTLYVVLVSYYPLFYYIKNGVWL
ncbi:hypothetical protein [Sulfurimonas autotrophica]|uniref:Uncharacterized protein n=1 Tax=Sulfurimonas autotrophica (strain ATCC BAA-671 / DSM 16294 / JCM 11897 / OK10) TaxID=563040 RepID=E0UU91_SULAO|nr:hypothetical protein [Sulfurimonas autotrophica]ADN09466.1 conserved hypothetical protein [Sulfurimonas autotrophica DSM 16294]